MDVQHPNNVLASLPSNDFELLRPHLKPFELVHEDLLFDAGETVKWIYFPHSGVISLVVGLADGQMIETAMVGRDSLVSASSAMDGRVSLNRGIVQVAGKATILDVETLRGLAEQSIGFRTILVRHEQALFAQAQQSAACNASHSVEARLARWLLRTRDLTGSDTLELTQGKCSACGGPASRSSPTRCRTPVTSATAAGACRSPICRACRKRPASAMQR